MSGSLAELVAKRERLIARAARERAQVAREIDALSGPGTLLGRGIAVLDFFQSNPLLLAGAALVLGVLRPRGIFKWARRGLALWQSYRWLIQKIAL